MRLLVTNDDGIHSVGIHVLAAALAAAGHDLLVIAPASERSGTGAALGVSGAYDAMDAVQMTLPGAEDVEAWSLDGTPAMCVLAARLGGFGDPPDVVVSGINAGLNTGRAVLHSGTVGAVLAGQNFGMSGLAVSTALADPWQWQTAADLAVEVLPMVLDGPARSALNLNVPALPRHEVLGVRWARLAPFGEVRAAVVGTPVDDTADGVARRNLRMELRLTEHDFEPDTDQGVVHQGWAALTALVGVVEAWSGDTGLDSQDAPELIDQALVPGAPLHVAHRVPDPADGAVLRRSALFVD